MYEVLPLDKLAPDPLNVRRHLGPVDGLAESLRAIGQLENLVVRPEGSGGYLVVCGHRRLAAAQQAELTELGCDVRDNLSDRDVAEMMLTENITRDDLHPLDEATAYR